MQNHQLIVQNIRKIRESKGYSQEYLASKLNIGQNAYSKLELGISKMTVERFFVIADVLETPYPDLFKAV